MRRTDRRMALFMDVSFRLPHAEPTLGDLTKLDRLCREAEDTLLIVMGAEL